MITLTQLESPTPMHLWFDAKDYKKRGYQKMIRPLLHAWKATSEIWKHAEAVREDSTDHEYLRNWILSLASQLNYGVSGADEGMRTPISSWEMVAQLSAHHSVLMEPEDVVLHQPRTKAELRSNPDGGGVKVFHVSDFGRSRGRHQARQTPRQPASRRQHLDVSEKQRK